MLNKKNEIKLIKIIESNKKKHLQIVYKANIFVRNVFIIIKKKEFPPFLFYFFLY